MLDRCLFAVRAATEDDVALVRRRAQALERFLLPVGVRGLTLRWCRAAGVVVGSVGGGPPAPGLLAFGSPDPLGPGASMRFDEERVRLVAGRTDFTALFTAGDQAWSTHAVAAALLALGEVRVRPEVVAELAAFGFVPGDAAAVEGVRALPPGAAVQLGARGVAVTEPSAQLPLVPERDAHAEAERRLVAGLRAWTAGADEVTLGLSGGLDSRVAALALAEAGTPFVATTWGREGWPDVAEARRVAAALGLEHRVEAPPAGDAAVDVRAVWDAARWSDAGGPLTGSVGVPQRTATHVTGAGGEIARAYFFAGLARARPRPSLDEVVELWRPAAGLRGADPGAVEHVERRAREMLERAAASGVGGWRVLDVVYARERVRRWGRAMTPPAAGPLIPAFAHPDLVPALVSLPLEDRLTSAFHRRFVARRAPGLVPPVPPTQRRGVPAVLRRAAARRRAAQDPFAGRGEAALPPALRDVLAGACEAALVRDALGAAFAGGLREALLGGSARAGEVAAAVAAPVALEQALAGLRA